MGNGKIRIKSQEGKLAPAKIAGGRLFLCRPYSQQA